MKRLVVGLVGAFLAVSCAESAKNAGTPSSTSSTTIVQTTVAPATTVATTAAPTVAPPTTTISSCTPFGGTGVVNVSFPGPTSSLMGQNIRTGRQDCFDRVVIDLQPSNLPISSSFPAYEVRWISNPVLLSPSDFPVTIKGGAVLHVTMNAWMQYADQGYTGPSDLFPANVTNIKELRLIQNFEGVMQWAIGVDVRRNFRVSTLSGPARLVIDIQTLP